MLTAAHTLPALLSEDPLLAKYVEEAVAKTAENISPLYRLDAFDWTVLTVYFAVLFVLSLYGAYRIKQVVEFWRYRKTEPRPKTTVSDRELPHINGSYNLLTRLQTILLD